MRFPIWLAFIGAVPQVGESLASAADMAWTEIPNPKVLGVEGVGHVVAVGDGVEDIEPGRRVAWVYAPFLSFPHDPTEKWHPAASVWDNGNL